MRFLVTGGAGFIGSHITEKLLENGHFVRVLDNFSSGKKENLSFIQKQFPQETVSNFELIEGDIRDKATCDKACAGIDYISHQAALRSVPKSMKDPESYNDVNINGTLYLLQAALKNKVKRFVFASSSSVYGDTDQFPEKEDAYPLLISPYALSKLANEYYCRIFSNAYGLETVGLRYFNVFGPRQALDDEYAVVIPKFIHCILHDEQPPIFGTGLQSRDFTYVDNVVQANILAATRGLSPQGTVPDKAAHEIFNVANGQDNTVLQLVDYLNKIIGKNIKPKFLPIRTGDVFRTCADISKIKSKLGFKPTIGFEEGLRKTVDYFRIVLLVIGLLSLKLTAFAGEPVTGTEVLRSQELILEDKSLREKTIDYKVFIKKIIVKGADLLSQDKLKEITLPFEKKWLTKYDIQTIEDSIIQAYIKEGIPKEKISLSFEVENNVLEITLDMVKTP